MVLALETDTQVTPSPFTGLTGVAFTLPCKTRVTHTCMQATTPGSVPEDLVEHVGHEVLLLIAGQAQQLGPQLLAGALGLDPFLLVLQPL